MLQSINPIVDICNTCDNRNCSRVHSQIYRGKLRHRDGPPPSMPLGCGKYLAAKPLPSAIRDELPDEILVALYTLRDRLPPKRKEVVTRRR